jgi:hypothetical protein
MQIKVTVNISQDKMQALRSTLPLKSATAVAFYENTFGNH